MPAGDDDLTKLVESVRASPRYHSVIPELVATIGARELQNREWKAAVKATRRKLHQVLGAFLEKGLDYDGWLDRFRLAADDPGQFRRVSMELMALHSSTRERLPQLEELYPRVLQGLPPPATVLDLACGLHPLAIPWMGLPRGVHYTACDVLSDLTDFLSAFLNLVGVRGHALACDVTRQVPTGSFDLVLLLKSLPCLERLDKKAGITLLDSIDARCVLVSFPVHSLGGRSKGMPEHYEHHLRHLVVNRPWDVERIQFASELVFRLTRRPGLSDVG